MGERKTAMESIGYGRAGNYNEVGEKDEMLWGGELLQLSIFVFHE
jgi:hypothetical protein